MKKRYILIIGLVLWHLLIWGQSLLPGDISSEQSGFIVDVLYPLVNSVLPNVRVDGLSFVIRKAAHFTEYFVLGILLYMLYAYKLKGQSLMTVVLVHGLLVASLDEAIQTVVPNRSGEIRDVIIDFSGIILSFMVIKLLIILIKHYKSRKHQSV